MTSTAADQLLGFTLPVDDPAATARVADELAVAAERLATLGRRVGGMLPVQRWSGVASAEADRLLATTGLALGAERVRLLRAGDALAAFSRQVAVARELGAEARRLGATAVRLQQAADLREPALAAGRSASWGASPLDGGIRDPAATEVLGQARDRAYSAQDTYDRAARRLTAQLSELSGRRVVRRGLSPRLLFDVVGLVPGPGDVVDLVNAGVYAYQGRWGDAAVTAAAAIPGVPGWVVAGVQLGKAWARLGDVVRVVDAVAQYRAVTLVASLSVHGRQRTTRLLPEAQIEPLYREFLQPLGRTVRRETDRGTVWVTQLSNGGRITFRRWSTTTGPTIDFADVPGVRVEKIHRTEGDGPDGPGS